MNTLKTAMAVAGLVAAMTSHASIITTEEFESFGYGRQGELANAHPTFRSVVGFNGGTGTWIGNTTVAGNHYANFLTAAHVTSDFDGSDSLSIRLWQDSVVDVPADAVEVINHPRFSETNDPDRGDVVAHDYAVVRVATDEPLQIEDAAPAGIYGGRAEAGKVVSIVGYGLVGHVDSDGLRVEEDGVGRLFFSNRVDGVGPIDDVPEYNVLYMDLSDPREGDAVPFEGLSAPGDSGGPAFIDVGGTLAIAGVSSVGEDEAYGSQFAYARVSDVSAWIQSVVPTVRTVAVSEPPLLALLLMGALPLLVLRRSR